MEDKYNKSVEKKNMFFDSNEYPIWRERRFNAIIKHYGEKFFSGKTLLEVGAGNGEFGALFRQIGSIVTSYEGREENFQELKRKNPQQNPKKIDFERENIEDKFDIILHCGLLYHLLNFKNHLVNCLNKCNHLILETEVVDYPKLGYWAEDEDTNASPGANVSGNYITKPTCSYLENIIKTNNFKYDFPIDPISINTGPWIYDWTRGSMNDMRGGLRQIWFCEKLL
jgi:hypothetical protein